MSKIQDTNYFSVQGWMITKLNLSGNDLLIYAIIHGFSQTSDQKFTGSLQYLADFTNSSRRGVQKNLESLVKKGHIRKSEKIVNNIKFCSYDVTDSHRGCRTEFHSVEQSSPGCRTKFHRGVEQSSHNNILDNIKDNKGSGSALEIYREFYPNYRLSIYQETLLETATVLPDKFREVMHFWASRNYRESSIDKILHCYKTESHKTNTQPKPVNDSGLYIKHEDFMEQIRQQELNFKLPDHLNKVVTNG